MAIQKTSFLKPFPFELSLPEGSGPFPVICITPILGRIGFLEDLYFERRFAHFFAAHGLAAALIERPFFEFNPSLGLEQVQAYLDDSVMRSQRILDWLADQYELRSDCMGSFGMSFGGIVNFLWAAKDRRLKANVFALIGGNIPEIMVTSRDPLMKGYLNTILKGTGLKKDELQPALEKICTSDPLRYAELISKERTLLILGIFDHVIHFRYGLALWRAIGKPETVFLPLGHYASLLTVPILQWKVLEFFKKKFEALDSRD